MSISEDGDPGDILYVDIGRPRAKMLHPAKGDGKLCITNPGMPVIATYSGWRQEEHPANKAIVSN